MICRTSFQLVYEQHLLAELHLFGYIHQAVLFQGLSFPRLMIRISPVSSGNETGLKTGPDTGPILILQPLQKSCCQRLERIRIQGFELR